MAQFIKKEEKEIFGIFSMIQKKEFKGNSGLAVKNSIFLFLTNLISKIGSFFLVIFLARILMPELFGLYSLVLATILLFAGFADLGVGQAIIKFVSLSLGKSKKGKAKSYFIYFLKIKSFLVIFFSLVLLILAKFLAQNYYQKPEIYLALLAGAIYIVFINLLSLYDIIFQSYNNFRFGIFKEITLQILRLILIPLIVFFSLRIFQETKYVLFMIILSLILVYIFSFILLYFFLIKKENFFAYPQEKLIKKEEKTANGFLILVSTTILSGIFFGYIDIIMLGRFVGGATIGLYQAAFNLMGGLIPLIPFASVLLPIFSRLKGNSLERGFNKSLRLTLLISFSLCILTIIFAPLIIKIVYGSEYTNTISILRILSILVILLPFSSIYESYFISRGRPGIIAKFLIISTILNIVLNYMLISWLINESEFMASMGAAIATILSRAFYCVVLFISRTSQKKIQISGKRLNQSIQ